MKVTSATLETAIPRQLVDAPRSQRGFFGISALLFVAGTALTIACCASMSKMGEMPMPGGWKMSLVWMQMSGESWLEGAASFLGMWIVMMVAMMQPVLVQKLWRYRLSAGGTGETRLDRLTALVAAAYFVAWTTVGVAIYPLGIGVAALEIRLPVLARAVPIAIGAIFVIAGAIQFTAWKAHHIACCRQSPHCGSALPTDVRSAWRYGLRLGIHCISCCFNFVVILLSIGIMDLRAMLFVTLAVSVERLAPGGERAARATGWVIVAIGITLIARLAVAHSWALFG